MGATRWNVHLRGAGLLQRGRRPRVGGSGGAAAGHIREEAYRVADRGAPCQRSAAIPCIPCSPMCEQRSAAAAPQAAAALEQKPWSRGGGADTSTTPAAVPGSHVSQQEGRGARQGDAPQRPAPAHTEARRQRLQQGAGRTPRGQKEKARQAAAAAAGAAGGGGGARREECTTPQRSPRRPPAAWPSSSRPWLRREAREGEKCGEPPAARV